MVKNIIFLFDIDSCLGIYHVTKIVFLDQFKVLLHICSWNPPFSWDQNNLLFLSKVSQTYQNVLNNTD